MIFHCKINHYDYIHIMVLCKLYFLIIMESNNYLEFENMTESMIDQLLYEKLLEEAGRENGSETESFILENFQNFSESRAFSDSKNASPKKDKKVQEKNNIYEI